MNIKLLKRRLLYKAYVCMPRTKLKPSRTPIDIVIPIIRKDLKILPFCLHGLKACVENEIDNIYIVAPIDNDIIAFCNNNNITFINEIDVLGFGPNKLNIVNKNTGTNRSGWIFQQLLKLSGAIGASRYFLCIDADHVLIRPHTFLTGDEESVFYVSSEYHEEYYININKLTNGEMDLYCNLSFISHKMIFDKVELVNLRNLISKTNAKEWHKSIIDSLDLTQDAGFSEFELYGNYRKSKVQLRPWNNLNLQYIDLLEYRELKSKYELKYNSLTFSEWQN